jgi:hypothetical protein
MFEDKGMQLFPQITNSLVRGKLVVGQSVPQGAI